MLSLSRRSFSVKLFSVFQPQHGLLLPRMLYLCLLIDHKVSLSSFLQAFRILLNYCWTLERVEWIFVHLLSSPSFLGVFPLSQVVNKDISIFPSVRPQGITLVSSFVWTWTCAHLCSKRDFLKCQCHSNIVYESKSWCC